MHFWELTARVSFPISLAGSTVPWKIGLNWRGGGEGEEGEGEKREGQEEGREGEEGSKMIYIQLFHFKKYHQHAPMKFLKKALDIWPADLWHFSSRDIDTDESEERRTTEREGVEKQHGNEREMEKWPWKWVMEGSEEGGGGEGN